MFHAQIDEFVHSKCHHFIFHIFLSSHLFLSLQFLFTTKHSLNVPNSTFEKSLVPASVKVIRMRNNLTNTWRAYPDGTPKHDYAHRPPSTLSSSHRLSFSPFSIHTPSSIISHPHHRPPHPHHPQPPYHHPRYPIPTQPLTSLPFPLLLLQILRRFHHRLLRHSLLPPGRCQ